VRIGQYVYFGLQSESVTAATITAHLGVEPDRISVRGSKRSAPAVPAFHSWAVVCQSPGLPLDDQAQRVLDRMAPVAGRVRELVEEHDVDATLTIVRYFDDEAGEDDASAAGVTPEEELFERLPGQHQLLGWVLPSESIELLASMRAQICADEYG
jgi:hypothetical protein